MRKCKICGKKIKENDKKCLNCGSSSFETIISLHCNEIRYDILDKNVLIIGSEFLKETFGIKMKLAKHLCRLIKGKDEEWYIRANDNKMSKIIINDTLCPTATPLKLKHNDSIIICDKIKIIVKH